MNATTLRQLFLDHLRTHGHAIIGAAPLVPENDPSVLFTTAGMHPLVPFLLGAPHPAGRRLANVQPCLRTNDILEVGDTHHLTFFEMLGNWSLGDYGKETAIRQSYSFLTARLGLDPARLWVTCFAGDNDAPRDDEAAAVWRALGIPTERMLFLPKSENWWGPAGITGPCGPDSEIFYDMQPGGPPGETPTSNPARFWEVGNNVFMQYDQRADGSYHPLAQHNIDLGMGLERLLPIVQGVPSIYETDLFAPIIEEIQALATHSNTFALRVVADHTRAAVGVLAAGVRPGNTDQPYIARRLIRRAARYGRELGITGPFLARIANVAIDTLAAAYPALTQARANICAALEEEEARFGRTLARGEAELQRAVAQSTDELAGAAAFRLYETFGFPLELTQELSARHGMIVDAVGFAEAFAAHQQRSRQGGAARFQGGLAERRPETTRLHTATHLLHAALRQVIGLHVEQRGSNITAERLRFDFAHGERLSEAELQAVEALVNVQITRALPVICTEMDVDAARAAGAIGLFGERYGERVTVYSIGDFSQEICGGPHVAHTAELGYFRIVKEAAVSAGVRRIRAVLGDAP